MRIFYVEIDWAKTLLLQAALRFLYVLSKNNYFLVFFCRLQGADDKRLNDLASVQKIRTGNVLVADDRVT